MAKSRETAIILSVLLAGLGQIYLRNYARGIVILISAIVIAVVSFNLFGNFGFIPSIIFFIWQIFDANNEFKKKQLSSISDKIICKNCDWTNSSTSEYCTKCGIRI